MKIKNKDILRVKYGEFCPNCYSDKIKHRENSFFCPQCKKTSSRLLIIDGKLNYWVDEEGNYWHESVGVVIQNKKEEILLIKLDKFPFGYSIPAGHVNKGENPKIAAKREVLEEVGLNLDNLALVKNENLTNDSCRRGADHHRWHLYKANIGDETVEVNEESSSYVWIKLAEALKLRLTSPARHFLISLS